jgi:hypothetical protein
MPATRRRRDDQTDYEDPIDRFRPDYDRPTPKKRKRRNRVAVVSYYCGVFALIPILGLLLGPLAMLLGFIGLADARTHPDMGGRGHARAGLIIGLIVICFHVAGVIALANATRF